MDRPPDAPQPPVKVVVWDTVPCPRCGLIVAFLPGQHRNKCAHCGKQVRR